jgi:hypothetical protein
VKKQQKTKTNKNKQKQTKTNKNKQKQTKTNKNKQKQTKKPFFVFLGEGGLRGALSP